MKEFIEKLNSRLKKLKLSVMLNNKCCKHIIDKIIDIVNELAEEQNNDFCKWEIVSDRDIHREYKPMCSEDGFIEITGHFDYEFCPYCGKKIKVVE